MMEKFPPKIDWRTIGKGDKDEFVIPDGDDKNLENDSKRYLLVLTTIDW